MDPLPLIPENPVSHEVTPILRRTLQDTLNGEIYPKQIAEQFVKDVKEDEPAFKHNAKRVLEIHERAQEITAKTQLAAADIMYQNALYLIQKDKLDCSFELRERIKLERCRLFKRLEAEFVLEFNLIKSSDLLPDMIHRYLDFRNHEHTICPGCIEKIKTKDSKQRKNLQIKKNLQSDTVTIIKKPSFHVDPKCVIFHNYDISEIYKRNVKIINTSGTTQSIAIRSLPETSYFSAMIINNQRLAPGMSVVLTITFKPKIFRNIEDRVVLKNKDGEMFELILSCTRDLPKLITCIFKSNSNLLDRCDPDSNHFVEKRREALNSTIDCGSCLVSQYVLISIVLENKGNDGKFFIITEDDWFFQNVETVSTCMELFKGPFWIYPTYFEICSEEIVEVNIIFQPTKPGLQVETLYLICNNNAFQQIELVGDALEFSKSYIEIDIPPKDSIINKKKDYCVYFGNVRNGMTQTLVVLIRNKSYLSLTCEWKFTNRLLEGLQNIKENWILQRNYHTKLAPYGAIEYEFKINFDAEKSGYHNIFFDFYITNIPLVSLEENEEFITIERGDISDKTLSQAVDVLIKEIEVCAMVDVAPLKVDTEFPQDPEKRKLWFSLIGILDNQPLRKNPELCLEHCCPENVLVRANGTRYIRKDANSRRCEGFLYLDDLSNRCACETVWEPAQAKMGFSCPVIQFGIVPAGLNIQKEFFIRNDKNYDLNWSILEVKYNLDSYPHMEVIKSSPNISEFSGFCRRRRNRKLFYKIVNKKPTCWVSILVLIAVNSKMESEIQDVCIVTYEVINFDIVINTKHSKHAMPALMPMHIMYRGVPTQLKFSIENRSLITDYFQFFPPFGEDRDRLLVELTPSSSVIKPFEVLTITATLICCDIGCIQNYFLPCFIGVGQEPLVLRVLCTVDGPHVVFYLPVEKRHLKKVTWPPKIVYEYDTDPYCICRDKECLQYEDQEDYYFTNYNDIPFENLLNKTTDVTYTISESGTQDNKTNNTKETEKSSPKSEISSSESGNTNNSRTRRLEGIISEEFDTDKILHDDIIEIQQVPIFTPTKVTVYIQNITPITAKYNFEPQRFVENKKFDHVAVRLHLKKREELWNDLMGTEYGILVQPEIASGELDSFQTAKIDIWIYANTYGIYSEEIFVDLLEMPSYHFSMLIEVVGSPLELPMAVNCITKYPTIRFNTVSFNSFPVTRDIKIKNTSSVPVHIFWNAFLRNPHEPDFDPRDAFNIFFQMTDADKSDKVFELVFSMDDYCGRNTSDFCYVEPSETFIKEHSSAFIQVVLRPEYFDIESEDINAVSCLVGHVILKPEHRKKPNYFIRKTGPDVNSLKIEATVTIEKPHLDLELGDSPTLIMRIYANDVLLKKNYELTRYTVLRNLGNAMHLLEIIIEEPFYFKKKNGKLVSDLSVTVAPKTTIELNICCFISYEQMLAISELVYDNSCYISEKIPFCKSFSDKSEATQVDFQEKIVRLNKRLVIIKDETCIHFPMIAFIYFPRISVSPMNVQFGAVLLRTTQKNMITIYNYTGYEVKFEIYKSSGATSFMMVPHYGEVPPCRGSQKSFVNVFIYFCPNQCKKYKESLRVVTNVPNYWAEIELTGNGTMNSKFAINYKI